MDEEMDILDLTIREEFDNYGELPPGSKDRTASSKVIAELYDAKANLNKLEIDRELELSKLKTEKELKLAEIKAGENKSIRETVTKVAITAAGVVVTFGLLFVETDAFIGRVARVPITFATKMLLPRA